MTRTLAAVVEKQRRMRETVALFQNQMFPGKTSERSKIVGTSCKSRLCPSRCLLASTRAPVMTLIYDSKQCQLSRHRPKVVVRALVSARQHGNIWMRGEGRLKTW